MSQSRKRTPQDTLREEIHLFLLQGERHQAIEHYQAKCGCSVMMASAYVGEIERQQRQLHREAILSKIHQRRMAFA